MLSRRRFLGLAGGAGVVATTGSWRSLLGEAAAAATSSISARKTLVVVQLAGGNDGLNTFVPDDGTYRDARPTLSIPEADVVEVRGLDGFGLHPALQPIVPLVSAGRVAVVQNVGIEHQGRSHFECSQHWWDGSDGHHLEDTGWIGRWLDATKPTEPASPLRALAVGGGSATPALRAEVSASTVVTDPGLFAVPDAELKRALRATGDEHVVDALDAVDTLAPSLQGVRRQMSLDADLALAAELIIEDIGIEVLLVGAGGFDTHSNQANTHDRLLGQLASGIATFQSAIDDAGLSDRVLLLTTSEFGRRVAQNGSGGTDHGLGSCLFAVGSAVRGGVHGDLDLRHLHEGDIHPDVDPRSWLAVGLDFLGGPTDEVFADYEDLGVLS